MSFVLFAYLIWQAGPSKLWRTVVKLGWGFMWVLALAGVSHVARAWLAADTRSSHALDFFLGCWIRLGARRPDNSVNGQRWRFDPGMQLSPEIPLANGLRRDVGSGLTF